MLAITAEQLRDELHYDPDTGLFTRAGRPCGSIHRRYGYRRIKLGGRGGSHFMAHRLAWLYMTGSWPADQIDHINGVRDDNRWANLRPADAMLNMQNRRRAHRGSRSQLLGVHIRLDGSFRSEIQASGTRYVLGTFDTAEAAQNAYLTAKRRLHPGCTI